MVALMDTGRHFANVGRVSEGPLTWGGFRAIITNIVAENNGENGKREP